MDKSNCRQSYFVYLFYNNWKEDFTFLEKKLQQMLYSILIYEQSVKKLRLSKLLIAE